MILNWLNKSSKNTKHIRKPLVKPNRLKKHIEKEIKKISGFSLSLMGKIDYNGLSYIWKHPDCTNTFINIINDIKNGNNYEQDEKNKIDDNDKRIYCVPHLLPYTISKRNKDLIVFFIKRKDDGVFFIYDITIQDSII